MRNPAELTDCGLIVDAYIDVSGFPLADLDGFQASGASVFVNGRCAACATASAEGQ